MICIIFAAIKTQLHRMESLIFSKTEIILLLLAAMFLIIQAVYYFTLYNRIYLRDKHAKQNGIPFTKEQPPVSVVISVRDDSEHLQECLTSILEQDYPLFEVIVINDGDNEESENIILPLENKYNNLYHSFVPNSSRYLSRKKLALTIGVKAAKYDWIVVTEPNCAPTSNQWLKCMARNFTSRTEVVLGYSRYLHDKSWTNRCIAFDNLFQSMRYLGMALAGKPYMGIGRNMAYRKELFFQQKGFSAHLNLQRGDDDLFINQIANGENTRVECCTEAIVQTSNIESCKNWCTEKMGYAQTARLLKGNQQLLLGGETASRLLFHVCWIAATVIAVMNGHWLAAGIALFAGLAKWIMQGCVLNLTAKVLNESRRYYLTLPVMDFLQPLQSLCWKVASLFKKKSSLLD